MTWVLDLVRMLLSVFDRMVYGLLEFFYNTFLLISQTRVLTPDTLKEFTNRIYIFLALIMLFKVSFSIVTYIINPDNFNNQEKGIGKIIQNVIITLFLLVLSPWMFTLAYDIQKTIVTQDIIPKIILGTGGSKTLNNDTIPKSMSFMTLNAFLKLNVAEIDELFEEDGMMYCGDEGTPQFKNGTYNQAFSNCVDNLSEQTAIINREYQNKNNGEKITRRDAVLMGEAYEYAYKNKDYNTLINFITAKYADEKDVYLYDYKYLICTIAGAFLAWIFLLFCFDIAVRSVKLSFLQLIAPVPIISYIDPKSSKNGMFQKWVKTCLSTYLDLFIRLISIYFAIYIISTITYELDEIYYMDNELGTPSAIINVLIIIGALMFAKQVPKLIEDITGIKLSGKFELNPLKKFEDNALGGKRITSAAAGLVTGGIAGAVAGHGIGRVGRFISGGLGGAGRGFVGGQGIRATRDDLTRRRHAMEKAIANGSTFGGRRLEGFQHAIGLDTELDRINRREDALTREEAQIANNQAAQRAIMSGNTKIADTIKKMEDRAKERIINGQAGVDSDTYLRMQEGINNLKSQRDAANAAGDTTRANALTSQIVSETQRLNDWLEDDAINNYIDSGADGVINGMVNDYNELCRIYHETAYTTAHDRHDHNRILRTANSDIERGFMDDQRRVDEIKEEKRELAEEKRVAQANMDAVSSRPPHGGGGRPH